MTQTLLLGAEGCAEAENVDWLREATDEEALAFWKEAREQGYTSKAITVDKVGRPYWLMTITDEAPAGVLEANQATVRTLRLKEVPSE